MRDAAAPVVLTRLRLDAMPLPSAAGNDDKNERGIVLCVGGSDSVPGAIMLSGLAALRAGAGKLQLATVRKAAIPLGLAVPEALVLALPTSKTGEIAATATAALLRPLIEHANAILFGPGMRDSKGIASVLADVVPSIGSRATLLLDGAAILALRNDANLLRGLAGRVVLTPNAGEMATLQSVNVDEIIASPARFATECAEQYGAVVAHKGGDTFIATPGDVLMHYREGKVGLATSGSGDTLAGIIAGLAARGAAPRTAAAWGVWAHGSAGNKLARTIGKTGFLARELLDEIPRLVAD